ncbi:thermonuclease family protein [Aureimonas sp. AU40]|uniref:thermonuclease family protein n=1 Tax=Aureimonas sp. AU40 TaxID=1637747 RepID=UPI000AA15134|nr:thermonuclease family protein [Aureimonas sp. AU40]
MADQRLPTLEQERAFASLTDILEGRPIDTSMERIVRDREAMEHTLFEMMADKPQAPAATLRRPSRRWLVVAAIGLGALAVWLASTPAPAAERIEGRATVVDGDTLAIEGTKARIRLYGMDAPESSQTCDDAAGKRYLCGSRAAQYLADLIGRSGRVTCFEEDRDRYGRIVAECATPGNVVLNAAMVKAGWAIEYKQYSDGRYSQEEAEAKAAKRGIWAGQFIEPSKWRNQGQRLESERVAEGQPKGCDIKGNISGSGKIYHMPGQQNYGRTKINEKAGERWFCSEAEARAAGWQPAKR